MDARDRELRAFLIGRPQRRRVFKTGEFLYWFGIGFFLPVAVGAAVAIAIQGGR